MSTKTKLSTITCPRCGQTLPGWAQTCQFCQATISAGYVRPTDAYKYKIDNRMSWREAAYVILGIIVVAQGGRLLLEAFNVLPNVMHDIGGGSFLGVFGVIYVALGLGMLFHVFLAQFILKWVMVLSTLIEVLETFQCFMLLSLDSALLGIAFVHLVQAVISGFTWYILNHEADV